MEVGDIYYDAMIERRHILHKIGVIIKGIDYVL